MCILVFLKRTKKVTKLVLSHITPHIHCAYWVHILWISLYDYELPHFILTSWEKADEKIKNFFVL